MKQLFAALLCSIALSAAAQAEVVLPRLSPLAVVDGAGLATGETISVPFGLPLEVLERSAAGGAIVTVQDATGARFAVSAADLIAPTTGQAGLVAMAEPGREAGERPDLPLWDSAARGRLYLQGGGADSLRPSLTEQPGGVFPATGLPVFAVETAPTTIGHPVLMAGAWVPVMPEALDPSGSAAPKEVVLHVLVDGSDYARDFTLETLQTLSRAVAEGGQIASFTRQVIYDNGALRDEGDVPAAGLRAEWPAAEAADGTLTDALASALAAVAKGIVPGDGAAHVVLVLVGPGLGTDPDALARVTAAGQALAGLRGIVLVQGTPEPNPANETVLAQMAGGTTAQFLDFGGDVMGAVQAVLNTAPESDATALTARRDTICATAAERMLPCVIAAPGVLPAVPAADWVALPLWFVMDGAALDLVPAGMAPADARLAQDAIRACHASGQVWDVVSAGCAATASAMPPDTEGLRADLVALQGELSTRSQERDAALDDLLRQTAEWDNQRTALRAEADEAMANLAAAQLELDRRAETISAQEAQVSEQLVSIADLTDRADALALSVSDLSADLDTAQAEAVRLGRDLDDRDAALLAATDQVAELTASRDETLADLAQAQDDLAAAEAEGLRLAGDLAALKTAQTEAEAALTQERADWQAKADAAAQALAEMTAARDQSVAEAAELTAAQTALQEQAGALTAQLSDVTAARDQSVTEVAALTIAQTALQGQVTDLTGQLADATAARVQSVGQVADLTATKAALEGQIADLSARLADLTDAQSQAAAQVAELTAAQTALEGQLADQSKARTTAEAALAVAQAQATQAAAEAETAAKKVMAQLLAAQADYAALVTERDDLAAKLSVQTARADDLEAVKSDLSLAESEIRADYATATRQLAEAQAKLTEWDAAHGTMAAEAAATQAALADAQAKLADLEAARTSAAAEAATMLAALTEAQAKLAELETARAMAVSQADTAQAALLDAQAQGLAAADRLAALQTDRDALAEQVTKAQADAAATVQDLADRLAKSEADVARLTDELTAALAARPMAEDMTLPVEDTLALAINPALKPKPRPDMELAAAPAKPPAKAPAKAAVKVAAAAPAPQPAASRRVAPASAAPQLKGCQFQWIGKEGRLVCP